jgi:hypothetical protein
MFKRGDKYAAEERKADAPKFTGTDRRAAPPPPPPAPPEPAPRRFHFLNTPLFGGHKQQGS